MFSVRRRNKTQKKVVFHISWVILWASLGSPFIKGSSLRRLFVRGFHAGFWKLAGCKLVLLGIMVQIPICSMFGIFTYIWVIYGANVGKYSIHGAYGICSDTLS